MRAEAPVALFITYPTTIHYPKQGKEILQLGISTGNQLGGLILQLT